MLSTILITLLLIIALLLGILFLPWKIGARGKLESNAELIQGYGNATVGGRSYGIMVRFLPEIRLCLGPYSNPWFSKSLGTKGKKKTDKTPEPKPKQTFSEQFEKLNQVPLWKKLLRTAIRNIHLEQCSIDGTVGFPNPMSTGLLMGTIAWIKTILPKSGTNLNIRPHFNGPAIFDLSGIILLRVQPAILAISVGWVYIRNK